MNLLYIQSQQVIIPDYFLKLKKAERKNTTDNTENKD